MKADIKAQWVADLRSGQFEQGTNYLEKVDYDGTHGLCCLGVLCRQAVAAGVIPAPELSVEGMYRYLDDRYDDEGKVTGEEFCQAANLPRKVQEWAGLTEQEGDVYLNPEQSAAYMTAVEANDMDGQSFAQIADLIELYVPVTE